MFPLTNRAQNMLHPHWVTLVSLEAWGMVASLAQKLGPCSPAHSLPFTQMPSTSPLQPPVSEHLAFKRLLTPAEAIVLTVRTVGGTFPTSQSPSAASLQSAVILDTWLL